MEQIYKKYVRYDPTCSHCYELQSVNLNKTFWERLFVTTLKSNRLYPLQDVHNLLPVKKGTSPCCLRISENISSKVGSNLTTNHKKKYSTNFINVTSLENELSLNDALLPKSARAKPKIKPIQEVVEISPFNECWPEAVWESCTNSEAPVHKAETPRIFNCRHVSKPPSLPTIVESQNMEPSTGNSFPETRKGVKSSSVKSLRNSNPITSQIPFKQERLHNSPTNKQRSSKPNNVNSSSTLRKSLNEHLEAMDDLEVSNKLDKRSSSIKLQESSGSTLKLYQSTASSWSSFLTPQENSNTGNCEGKQPNPAGEGFYIEEEKSLPILTRKTYKSLRFRRALHCPWSHFKKEKDVELINTLCPSESLINILNSNSSVPVLKRIKLYEDIQKNHLFEKSKEVTETSSNNITPPSLKDSGYTSTSTMGKKSQRSSLAITSIAEESSPKTSYVSKKESTNKSQSNKSHRTESTKTIQPPRNPSFHQIYNKTGIENQLLLYISGVLKARK